MKKIITALLLILSMGCFSQNKYSKEFLEANSVFNYIQDSIVFEKCLSSLEMRDCKLSLTLKQCLLMHFSGYINGSLNYKIKGDVDFISLLNELKHNKKLIEKQILRENK